MPSSLFRHGKQTFPDPEKLVSKSETNVSGFQEVCLGNANKRFRIKKRLFLTGNKQHPKQSPRGPKATHRYQNQPKTLAVTNPSAKSSTAATPTSDNDNDTDNHNDNDCDNANANDNINHNNPTPPHHGPAECA
jgi:hypothetical protein